MWRTTVLFGHLLGAVLSNMIKSDHVRVVVGEEAHLTCQLTQPKNVLQVTWQKITPGGTEDVGSCNKRFGTKINPPFQGLVEFEDTGLQNTTIVVRNVTKADECCYRCLFNAYPEGAIYRKTCLTVYEQPEPILHVTTEPNGRGLTIVSCATRAMSHPAPTVTLEVPAHAGSSNYSTVHTANVNGTVTVTSEVTLHGRLWSNGTRVRCALRLPSGVVKEASAVIYSDKRDACDKSEACQSGQILVVNCVAAAVVVGVIILAFGLVFRLQRQRKIRSYNDPENQTTIHQTKEPFVTQDQINQCSPQKNKPIEYPNT